MFWPRGVGKMALLIGQLLMHRAKDKHGRLLHAKSNLSAQDIRFN
ncbi:hypothetical protein EI77_01055 [Prosthecobacter fusiformis]|uniref:Uncharacterized protein n=1 Tax=Prosthecobacter fusiformis TaxID=48464 RepID=A0A4R7SSJ6_9BACT|nr:hypothetical protein EI77_01055 [Prosthecobacter fusiformis]